VLLVTGPTELPLPLGVTAHRVETTAEMQRAVQALVKKAHVLIMAAAPADYRPATSAATKRPRRNGTLTLELEATPDILATLERPRPCVVVGFALEAGGDGVAKARQKLQDKALDFVILNDALEPGAGFEVATNRVTIIGKAGAPIELPRSLGAVATLVAACTKCRRCEGRRHTVPGEGPGDARLVVVGEGPGRVEDETGRPFVGQAGELLTKILAAIQLRREQVFICN